MRRKTSCDSFACLVEEFDLCFISIDDQVINSACVCQKALVNFGLLNRFQSLGYRVGPYILQKQNCSLYLATCLRTSLARSLSPLPCTRGASHSVLRCIVKLLLITLSFALTSLRGCIFFTDFNLLGCIISRRPNNFEKLKIFISGEFLNVDGSHTFKGLSVCIAVSGTPVVFKESKWKAASSFSQVITLSSL